MEIFSKINDFIDYLIAAIGVWGPFLGCFLIIIESIVPILPLFTFITLNFLAFGKVLGFIISWVCTILGCLMSFFMFKKGFKNIFERHLRNKKSVDSLMKIMDTIKFENLVTLIAIPFTPAFAINIAAGLSNMPFKKYFKALLIGKIFLVYFWGFVGTSLVESLKNPMAFVKVVIITILAYAISKIVSKKLKIDER